MVTLEFAVLVLPSLFVSNGFHDIPMLCHLTVLNPPQIVVGSRSSAKGALGNGQYIIALCKNLMDIVIDHLNALLSKCLQSSAEAGKAISNSCVVLNIGVTVKVGRCLFRSLALHYVVQEVLDDLTVLLSLIEVFQRVVAVNLCMSGRIRSCLCREIVPMLGDLTVSIETEDVKGDLFSGSCEVVDRLQKYLVSVLESADVIDSSLNGSGCKIGNAAYESVSACAISEVVLNVAGSKKLLCLCGITVCECADKCQCLFFLCHDGILLKNL